MYVLSVIPLSRTAPPEPLSYRSTTKLTAGTLVSIPLRKKIVAGLVLDCVPVKEAKFELKTASFSLSKSTDLKQGQLPPTLISAARAIALYHATTLGAVLSALLVPVLSDGITLRLKKEPKTNQDFENSIQRLEVPLRERRKVYEQNTTTTLLVVPTQIEAEQWSDFFKARKPIVLSGKLTSTKREIALTRVTDPHFRGLVIATPGFAWVPIVKLERILIERVSAGSYQQPKRPYIDVRYALTEIARSRNIPITYGDYPLPIEYRSDPEAALTNSKSATPLIQILDTRSNASQPKVWHAVHDALRSSISSTLKTGGRVAVLAVRKGYAPIVVCGDCGTTLTDSEGRSLTLATAKDGKRIFRSTDGTQVESAESFCKVCGSWNLQPLGIGIERVEEELRAAFPNHPLVVLGEESKKTRSLKKVREEIAVPGTLIVGTESMLSWLSLETIVELGVIASADSLLALPFWRSRERFVRVGLMLAERSQQTIVATRRPEDAALSVLRDAHDPTFWREETGLRKILSYPPFGTLITFHIEASRSRINELIQSVQIACQPFIPILMPEHVFAANVVTTTLVLHLTSHQWPNQALSNRISGLSPAIRVRIDSETLW